MARVLRDKIIVITGASSGIGAATAIQAAEAGMHVVLAARRVDRLEQVAAQIRQHDRQVLVVPTDVASDSDVKNLIDRTMSEFGRLDVMFANAGYGGMHPLMDRPDEDHRRIFEVNYWGTVRCMRGCIPIMQKQGGGHIVVTSSTIGKVSLPCYGPYCATKAAQDALLTAVRHEVSKDNIFVSGVYPIGTKSEFFVVGADIAGVDAIKENTPDWLMQTPEKVARCIVKCLRRPRSEVWPALIVRFGIAGALAFPGAFNFFMRFEGRKNRRFWNSVARSDDGVPVAELPSTDSRHD